MHTLTQFSFPTRVRLLLTRGVLASTVAFMAVGASTIAVPPAAQASPMVGVGGQAISRATIVARGKTWVDRRVPYGQHRSYQGYRTDCSGFISMAWNLKTSVTTGTLAGDRSLTTPIPRSQLRPGDILVRYDRAYQHAVLFVKWSANDNGNHRVALIYHEASPDRGTVAEYENLSNSHYGPYKAYKYRNAR